MSQTQAGQTFIPPGMSRRYYRLPAHLYTEFEEWAPKYLYDESGWSILVDGRTSTGLYDIDWVTTPEKHEWLLSHDDVAQIDEPKHG